MSRFITPEDYSASVHKEILEAVTRNDEAVIEICEDRAIADMRGYLGARYDVDALFSAEGRARNQLVLMMAIDITVYHLFCIHNPQKLSQLRKDRYERAVEWLEQVAGFKVAVDGAPLLPKERRKQESPWSMTSNPKRVTHL
ncbi:phage protein Gp36 family protein [Bacteroides fluxus]|uniref:phage protein Gp36 family protein n=1 Tax=Bacteroides fluxus TaxID=626930 RepID=UPI002355C09D|nr:phage protein Gp36 family protein [Bacteroides fluxus]